MSINLKDIEAVITDDISGREIIVSMPAFERFNKSRYYYNQIKSYCISKPYFKIL
jgi:hypothetical protein